MGFNPPWQELHRWISEDEIPLAELKLGLAKSPEEVGTDDEEDMLLSKIQAGLQKENLPLGVWGSISNRGNRCRSSTLSGFQPLVVHPKRMVAA